MAMRRALVLLLLLAACERKPAEVTTPPAAPQPAAIEQPVAPEPAKPKNCTEERGADAARILANRCRMVSGATHPPCNPDNSCAMIEAEIARACADMTDVDECAGPTAATSEGIIYHSSIDDH